MEYVVDLKFVYQDESATSAVLQFDLMGRVRGPDVSYIVSVSVLLLVQIFTRLKITRCASIVSMWCYRLCHFFLQNRNIEYITDTTCAEITVQAMWSGARDGLTVVIRHETITGIVNAEFLLYKLLEGVSN